LFFSSIGQHSKKRPTQRKRTTRSLSIEILEDRCVPSTFTVLNLNDSGADSLRQAILNADAQSGADVINFSVAGTIQLTSGALPAFTDNVDIDGTSAPGFAGTPVVEIDYNHFAGLLFNSGAAGSDLGSLALVNASGAGVTLDGGGGMLITGNFIGLALDGTTLGANGGNGLELDASSGNTIGGNTTQDRNVISGNLNNGIYVNASSTNQIVGNFIGTDVSGTLDRGNAGNGIVLTAAAAGNIIGGQEAGGNDPTNNVFVRPPQGNLISGNAANGVLITGQATQNTLSGNFIGTALSGNSALANTLDGVAIDNADGNALVGCTLTTNPFVFYNVISGNGANGLRITNSNNTTVQGNFFGLGADNQTAVANVLNGVLVAGSSANTVMGGPIPLGNVDAANGQNGILIQDTASFFISYNTFCGLAAFQTYTNLGNGVDGIKITSTGGNILLRTNVITENGNDGIEISGAATGVRVAGNIIGLDTNGNAAMGNKNNGVEVDGSASNIIIGGPQLTFNIIPHNAISANGGYGVAIDGNANNVQLSFSFIGTDLAGLNALGNAQAGLFLGSGTYANTIGSADPSLFTVISGNVGDGIALLGTNRNSVVGTLIGTDITGTLPLPNGGNGVSISNSSDNVIGRTPSNANAPANLIAFNAANGVLVASGSRNAIQQDSIYANALLGIDLMPGANRNQAPPLLAAVRTSPFGTQVSGTLTSTPNSTFTIEFFGNTVNGASGRLLLGSMAVGTNAAGIAAFTFSGPLLQSGANFVTATATDALNNTSAFSAVAPFNPLTLPGGNLPDATINIAYDQTITATGGTGADTFAVTAGSLPTGLSLNSNTGAITGTPTVAATANFTITATDSLSASASQSYSLVVLPAAFVYNAATGILTITGVHFSFAQTTTANVSGLNTTYTFTIDGVTQAIPDTAISSVVINGRGAGSIAILVANDTYVGTDNKTHETAEIASLGAAGVGDAQLLKFNAADRPFVFLQLNNFNTSYAYVGKADSGLLYGAAGETNGFVTAGNYSYMSAPGYFHLIQGAPDVYGYSASPTDFAFHYDGSGPSTYRVDGTTQSYMSGTDNGASFFNVAESFVFNTAVALHPRQDVAYFIDSPGNDVFSGNAKASYMYSDNAAHNLTELDAAFGFATVFANSINGGMDLAYVYSTSQNTMSGAWVMLVNHP
jgi:hypothetical protein